MALVGERPGLPLGTSCCCQTSDLGALPLGAAPGGSLRATTGGLEGGGGAPLRSEAGRLLRIEAVALGKMSNMGKPSSRDPPPKKKERKHICIYYIYIYICINHTTIYVWGGGTLKKDTHIVPCFA